MDFWQVLEERHSVREFRSRPWTCRRRRWSASWRRPSGRHRRATASPGTFTSCATPASATELAAAAYGQAFVAQAPLAIVVCADAEQSAGRYGQRGRELYCLQDTAAAIEHILLAAVALGLGGCWVGAFDEDQAASALDLPERTTARWPSCPSASRPAQPGTRTPAPAAGQRR